MIMENVRLTLETRKIAKKRKSIHQKLMIIFPIIIIACLLILSILLFTRKCPKQCQAPMSYVNGRCYYIYLEKNNFFQIPCVYLRPTTDRVSIESAEELQGLTKLIRVLGLPEGSSLWTAANRLQALDFAWAHPFTSVPSNLTYSRWLPGEPSNMTSLTGGEEKNCLQLRLVRGELYMVTANCYSQAYQICERAHNATFDGV